MSSASQPRRYPIPRWLTGSEATSVKSSSIQSSSARCASAFSCCAAGGGAPSLERWFDAGVQRLRCLPWEAETGLRWAQLLASLRTARRAMPIKDSLIAATALVHGLTVVTRNRIDFEKTGLGIFDPFG